MVKKIVKNAKTELLNWGWKDFLQLYLIIVVGKVIISFVSYL
tara:strand:- start:124 stop:249 length:126 start_codon:yes stop_codon:yes gene_type:complete